MMKKIILTLLLFFCSPSYSDNSDWVLPYNKTYQNAVNGQDKHLYIGVATEIERLNLDTVTYYFTSSEPNEVLYDSFKQFAKDIGKKDGAVYIPLNNKSIKTLKNNRRKQDLMYNYTKVSNCDFSYATNDSLLFEIRDLSLKENDRCISFPVKNNALWLSSLLKKLSHNINNLKNNPNLNRLKKDSITSILMNGVDTTLDKSILERNKSAIRRLVEWLGGVFQK